jgi:anti-anti-sigma regulatory factor
MDAATADHVIKLVAAVELLGARGIVVGIQPGVAQAIVSIGADLSRIATLGSVRDALLRCMGQTSWST